ncbi:MAG: phage tail tape measure C-terminal domain-containing protein [Rhizomicrobium sp.]|nr:phage tail tape measure C-terminal domain-containing protein [Rhizomicrobium sp.]
MPNDPLTGAGQALSDFAAGPVESAARSIESSMDRAFTAMENAIARAVVAGKASLADLVTTVIASLDKIGTQQFVTQPLENVLSQVVSSVLPVAGARANGGPVEAGSAYLVGENGPELFVPPSSGSIVPNARPAITLNVQAQDAASFLKSETQLAAMLSRALARGQRNM